MKRALLRGLACLLLIGGSLLCAQALYPTGKGWLAMHLIEKAYSQAPGSRPWPQADFRGIARLQAPRLGVNQIVLDQATPRTLAFGPGLAHNDPYAGPIISAHRDTHFSWLKQLQQGDELIFEQRGKIRHYRVIAFSVANSAQQRISLPDSETLLLTTCWPLQALTAGGSMRYLVTAMRQDLIEQ